jgi:hypothetical protein
VPLLVEDGTLVGVAQLLNNGAGGIFPAETESAFKEFCAKLAPVLQSRWTAEEESQDALVQACDSEVVKLANKIVADAHGQGAGEIRIRNFPGREKTRIDFVKHGAPAPFIEVPGSYRVALMTRLKVMAGLKVLKKPSTQAGTIPFEIGTQRIELRIELVPGKASIEDAVIRFISSSGAQAAASASPFARLVADGTLSAGELELAERAARKRAISIDTVLEDEFQVQRAALGAVLARHFGVPYEPYRSDRVKPSDLVRNLSRGYVEVNGWLPVGEDAAGLAVICLDPARMRASRVASNVFPKAKIDYRVTTHKDFARTIEQFYGNDVTDGGDIGDLLSGLDDDETGMAAPLAAPAAAAAQPDATAVPGPISDQVYFTVTAPKTLPPAKEFVLDVWAHLEGKRAEVLARASEELAGRALRSKTKGAALIERGKQLAVQVAVKDFDFSDGDTILWTGASGNASFAIPVPKETKPGTYVGTARFAVDGIQVSRLHFELEVGAAEGERTERTLRERRPGSAFASYASEDRDQVLARIQGMQKLLPDLDIFLDIASIRSGENWAKRLEEEIVQRDTFYLFWSAAASRSQFVEQEWRAALRLKGIDNIDPVPLEPPQLAPPPAELGALHFNEWTLAFRRAG